MSKQSILLIGATGEAGSNILNGLKESNKFVRGLDSPLLLTNNIEKDIISAVRPSSATKPEANAIKARGIEIRHLDLESATADQLSNSLNGIDTVISAVHVSLLDLQKPLADACKKAGVKRLIPCDWGPSCTTGVRKMFDRVSVPLTTLVLIASKVIIIRNSLSRSISRVAALDTHSLTLDGGS